MSPAASHAEKGSMLVEVLVAFAILSGAVILSFRIFGDGLRNLREAEISRAELAVAAAELEKYSLRQVPITANSEGISDSGIHWRLKTAPTEASHAGTLDGLKPIRVEVWAAADGRLEAREPMLETLMLVPAVEQ